MLVNIVNNYQKGDETCFIYSGCLYHGLRHAVVQREETVECDYCPETCEAGSEEFKHTDDVPWLDKTYKVEVHRFVADSLPKVKDEQGNPYFDNLIRVRVLRADGSEFFNRVFSKKSFNDYLDENTRKTGALLGIVFDHAEGDNLYLGASVGSPDRLSDEYIPLILTISRMGDVGIKRDTKIDSDVPEEEEEGV